MLILAALLFQALTAPDPAQMEHVPDLGYMPVEYSLNVPAGVTVGAPSSVAITADGRMLVFNRGSNPLLEFAKDGKFIRSFGEGLYTRAHGMRLDAEGNIWTTDVGAHTVTKMNPRGEPLLTIGVKGQGGDWNESANARVLNEPNDVAFGPRGEIYVVQGHGRADPRVLKFDKAGKFVKMWGGKGTGPGQFDIAHSAVIDGKGLLYIADRQNRRVQIFDADGKAIAATGQPGKALGEFGEAHYLAMGTQGEIYVADTVKPAFHKFVKK